jgi:uncharacterized protein GlcG (DUF336 family)
MCFVKRYFRELGAAVFWSISSASSLADVPRLTQDDVRRVVEQAATEARNRGYDAVVAVADREGFLLALWDTGSRLPDQLPPFSLTDNRVLRLYGIAAGAATRAGTAAFLSSDENAFTSRTAGFIIQQHFPPGVRNTPPGPLVGVGFSNLFFSDVNRLKLVLPGFEGNALVSPTVSPGSRAPSLIPASLNDSPGGVPLYKGGHLVGGVGVTGDGSPTNLAPAAAILLKETQKDATTGFKSSGDVDELVALAGQTGFRPNPGIVATNVLIGGIRVPYVGVRVEDIVDLENPRDLSELGHAVGVPDPLGSGNVAEGLPKASPELYPYERRTLGGFEGEVRFVLRGDPLSAVAGRERILGQERLTQGDVETILGDAASRAAITRAGIRLPVGTPAKVFITVVNNPNKAGEKPEILGVFRTGEATMFSWDVSAQKARTALFFSNRQLAMSSRSVGFLAQRYFPPGLDGRPYGPYFGFQEAVTLRQAAGGGFPGNMNLPNGITIFPGGFPIYRNGVVIGAVGVSGDGIDQDDIIASSGTASFLPPRRIRADQYTYRGARLPYVKFPRDPVR